MKQVSFEVAKAIKNAGYPQLNTKKRYTANGALIYCMNLDDVHNTQYDAPNYLEVWLWLWRKKQCNVTPIPTSPWDGFYSSEGGKYSDPEEAIIASIEYLCDNDLIK